ncbi:MAG: acyltransferase [Atopostipes sp.]|nr:acyltransferase [Atopostipes sp.]
MKLIIYRKDGDDNMKKKKYIGAYDGIRAIALLGVFFYHLIPSTVKGGYLGVVTFFVLAGYLTTYQAMKVGKEENRTSLIFEKIKDKIVKLYPPLLLMIFSVVLFLFIFLKADLASIAKSVRTALLSVYNYAEIFSGGSYFESAGKLAPFTHLWALSLELQFYLLFFITVFGKYKKSKKKKYFRIFVLLAIFSYLFSIYLIDSGVDFTRVYYGTETRLYSFLLGGAAALISEKKKTFISNTVREIAVFVLLLISISSFFLFDISEGVFIWVFPLYSLLIAILMMMLRHSKGIQAQLLSSAPFSFLSKRSYHIYLWHFPILAIQEKMMAHLTISNQMFYLVFFILTILLSEFSYQISKQLNRLKLLETRSLVRISVLSFIIMIIPYQVIADSSEEKQELDEMEAAIRKNEKLQKEKKEEEKTEQDEQEKEEQTEESKDLDDIEETNMEETEFTLSYENAIEAIQWVNDLDESLYLDPDLYTKYRRVKGVLIGDSMASMAYHTLLTYMPDLIYDTEHSRQMDTALEAYTPYMDEESSGEYIILSLGTNGEVLHEDIDRVREANRDKYLILTTIVLPNREQEEERNKSIRSYAEEYENVYLVDWYAATKDKSDLFFDDQIHTGERGARVLGQLIMNKIIEIEMSK